MEKRTKRIFLWFEKRLPYFVLAAAYAISVGLFALYGEHNLDSDMSSEMVLANLLNKEGKILSTNWFYSTEIRFVSPVIIYQLGLKLFDSWHMARTFAVAVTLLGLIASVLYMARGAGMKKAAIYCAAAMILPLSRDYWLLFLYGGCYTVHFSMVCLVIGVILRLDGAKRRIIRLSILCGLSILLGMGGVRQIMILGAPLIASAALLCIDEARRHENLCSMKGSQQMWIAVGSVVSVVGLLVGYVINSKVLSSKYIFQNQNNTFIVEFTFDKLIEEFNDLLIFLGYDVDAKLLSLGGLSAWASIILLCMMLISVYILLTRFMQAMNAKQRLLALFAGSAVLIGLLLSTTTNRGINNYNSVHGVVYYISGILMMVVSAYLLIEVMSCRMKGLRHVTLFALTMAFFLVAGTNVKKHYRSTDANYEDAADWLVNHGYTQGFSTFWNGNVMIEASDGKLDMYVFPSWTMDALHSWLQDRSHFEALPEGKVFVYVDTREEIWDPCACADESRLIYESVGGRAYAYDSAQEVMEIQSRYRAEILAQRADVEESEYE